jgi:hypothetical protein
MEYNMNEQNTSITIAQERAIAGVKLLANIVHALYSDVMRVDIDYGIIPGTGDKPTLLLPGMEKLMRALELRPDYIERRSIIDFDKGLFYFQYECQLVEIDTGRVVASAIGSANSQETKWRWRNADRACPHCGKATIIKGKEEYGGGWLCFAKKGGCGAKFKDDDTTITSQVVGRIENPDIADQLNTIDKIAQKRALSSAIKGAANVSELFTVDLDDLHDYVVNNAPELPALPVVTAVMLEPLPLLAIVEKAEVGEAGTAHWSDNGGSTKFFLRVKALNLVSEDVLANLEVDRVLPRLSDTTLTFEQAMARLEAMAKVGQS